MRRIKSLSHALSRIGLSTSDAASLLNVHRSTIWRWKKKLYRPRGVNARAVERIIRYSNKLRKKATNVEHRKNVLKKILSDIFPPPPPPPPPPLPPLITWIELNQFVMKNIRKIQQVYINNHVLNDTVFGWLSDHGFIRRSIAEAEGDYNNYWRISLDYRVELRDDGGLWIWFGPYIVSETRLK